MNAAPPLIVCEGDAFAYEVVRHVDGKYAIHATAGEEYQIDCPFCTDTRQRLYVHHMFGCPSPDPRTPPRMYNLAYCQNEGKTKFKLRTALADYDKVLNLGLVVVHKGTVVGAGEDESVNPYEQEPPPVGEVVPLDQVPDSDHGTYWSDRGYDISYLSRHCGACVCRRHEEYWLWDRLKDRVIFPYTYEGRVIMWQARLNYNPDKKLKLRKWWFPPRMKKVLWNMDLARQFDVCILCEGISSAICAGPAAMGVGGKTLNHHMRKFIKQNFKRVMVMLDPDAGVNRRHLPGKRAREKDYQEMMIDQLKGEGVDTVGARWVEGDDRDPGDLGFSGCMELVRRSSKSFAEQLGYAT